MSEKVVSYADLEDYCRKNSHVKKQHTAGAIRVSPSRFSKLKARMIRPTAEELERIAELLNQPVSRAKKVYGVKS